MCWSCGAQLPAVDRPGGEERRVVTVLFVDLVDFTGISTRLDPEDLRRVQAPYFRRVRTELERFGGHVEKYIGDAVMALFGAPVAHGDDAHRAVLAAFAIRRAIGELNDEEELDLKVRIAVNTGEAFVDLGARTDAGEGMAAGDVVVTSFRLQQAAPVGEIVVGEATYRATQRGIEYVELEPVTAKGKPQPLRAWKAVAVDEPAGRPAAKLVGRDGELAYLQSLVGSDELAAPRLVTLVGGAGVGKSRLLWELRRSLEEGPEEVVWRQGRCLGYGSGVSFSAFAELVKSHAEILESDAADTVGEKLGATVASLVQDGGSARLDRGVPPPAGGPRGGGASQRRSPWRGLLRLAPLRREHRRQGTGRPRVRGPPVGRRRSARLHRAPVPLVGGTSAHDRLHGPPGAVRAPADVAGRGPGRAAVGGGHDGARRRAARQHGAPWRAPRGAARARSRQSAVRRGVRPHVPGAPQRRRGSAAGDRPGAHLGPPGHAAPRGQGDPPRRRGRRARVLDRSAGAVSGRQREQIERRLGELQWKELVRPHPRSAVADESQYTFWHVLVRDVAYAQIPRAARAEKHRLTAEWIESVAPGRADLTELLAHHYTSALEYARLARQETAELVDRARTRSATRATGRSHSTPTRRRRGSSATPSSSGRPTTRVVRSCSSVSAGRCSGRGAGVQTSSSARVRP